MTTRKASEAWTRDSVIDANQELARKRLRKSEETDLSPRSPSNDSVAIEAVETAPMGTSLDNAIQLYDDLPVMETNIASFSLWDSNMSPTQQLERLMRKIDSGHYIEPDVLISLAVWIRDHLAATVPNDTGVLQAAYVQEQDFFANLGEAIFFMLARFDNIIDSRMAPDTFHRLREAIELLYTSLTSLSTRILLFLPSVVESTISRRDSACPSTPHNRIRLLWYLQTLAQMICGRKLAASHCFKDALGFASDAVAQLCRAIFLHEPSVKRSLIKLLKLLGRAHSEVVDAWEAIDAILWLARRPELCLGQELEVVLDIARVNLLPVVCEKHPRALPDSFLDTLISTTSHAIKTLVYDADMEDAALVYLEYIRGDGDALLSESTGTSSIPTLLADLVSKQQGLLAKLMTTAWTLQVLKKLIFSDIMDVRSQGVTFLSHRLGKIWARHHGAQLEGEHPVLQYVARFMRVNELTKYILGPNSHASLVSHSQDIIGFLAAVGAFTELEADIIWHACSTSVEAEFVRASFDILNHLYVWLDMDHLRYLAHKYLTIPPSRIGRDAVDSLNGLLTRMNLVADKADDQRDRLAYPFTCVRILKHVTISPEAPCSEPLCRLTRSGLADFARIRARAEDRIQIYTTCVSDILAHAGSATTSIEILLLFLRRQPALQEAEWLRTNLTIDALSTELAHFVESLPVTMESPSSSVLNAIGLRIEAMVRLLTFHSVAPVTPDGMLLHSFYRYIVGDKAIHNDARQAAWVSLTNLRSTDPIKDVAGKVVHHFLVEEAMNLPPENITPQLVELWDTELMIDILTKINKNTSDGFLSMPLWQKLVETAEGPTMAHSHQLAVKKICSILFNCDIQTSHLDSSLSYDAEFTNRQIGRICSHHQTYIQSNDDDDLGRIIRGIDILDAILSKSRQPSQPDQEKVIARINIAGRAVDGALSCTLRIRGTTAHLKEIRPHVSPTTTVHQLLTLMSEITGAAGHRITVAGKELDLEAEASTCLSQLNVNNPGVILVSPNDASSTNMREKPAISGAVEQQILAHFASLEKLLTGSEVVSEKIYQLLAKISPPVVAKNRFMADDVTAVDIFPPSNVWQSIYYIFVLKDHLGDCCQTGTVDEQLFVQSVRLLITVLVDEKWWPVQSTFHMRVMDCLAQALEENVEILPAEPLVEDADRFTSRTIDLCFCAAKGMIETNPSVRLKLVDCTMRCLFLLSHRQGSVWKSFTQHTRFIELNKTLLISSDRCLSTNTANLIRRFCLESDTVDDMLDLYLDVVIAILPDALRHGNVSNDYFVIAAEVVKANRTILTDENRARALVQAVIAQLWDYDHSESVDLPLVDTAIAGLLRVLAGALSVLRNSEKRLNLQGLSTSLFRRLLFPRLNDVGSRVLIDPHTRSLVYDLVISTCQSVDNVVELIDGATTPLFDASHDPSAIYPGRGAWLRPAWKCAGLTNLGMTCYMNSLLQQLFSNIQFRKFIFDTAAIDPDKQSFLFEVQKLFSNMQDEYSFVTETGHLAHNLGTQIENQEDVHGFYEDFLSRLEINMPDETSKAKLNKFFTGKLITQIKGECGHVSPKSEAFVDLPIIVKNKPSLQDSLDEFVQGEPMEGVNKYRCQACDPDGGGRLVDAMRRTCLEQLPENVTFCLKRFTFEAMLGLDGKVNDRFEFPENIDLSRYLRVYLENPSAKVDPDIFELVGVIVHQGTLQIGHYWSYALLRSSIRPGGRTWVKLEDGNVSTVEGITEIQQECFGGQIFSNGNQRSDNAYVLFYQRKSSLEAQMSRAGDCFFEPGILLPPKAAIPTALKRQIHEANSWRQRIAHLFDDDYASAVEKLLSLLRRHISTSNSFNESEHSRSDDASSEASVESGRLPDEDLMDKASDLGMTYLLRIATCDPKASQKVDGILIQLCGILADQPKVACKLLDRFFHSIISFQGIMGHTSETVRSRISSFILQCMACLREQDWPAYEGILSRFQRTFSATLGLQPELNRVCWPAIFGFAADLAQTGVEETKAVLDTDALRWSFEVLHLLCDPITAQKNVRMSELLQSNPSRVSALYNFIGDMLSSHVDLSEDSDTIGLRRVGNDGVLPQVAELEFLSTYRQDGILTWIWLSKYAETKRDWKEFAPGRLMAVIMNHEDLQALIPTIEAALQRHNEREEQNLNALLHLTLRFCVESGRGQGANKVFNALAKTFSEWDRALDIIAFMHQAYALVPETTVQSIHLWCEHFLMHKSHKVQQHTEQWLQEALFQSNSDLSSSALEAYRVRQIRKLVLTSCAKAKAAYDEEKPRAKFEPLLNVFRSAISYLKSLRAIIKTHLDSSDAELRAKVGTELYVEFNESRSCLTELEEIWDYLADWLPEDGLPPSSLEHVSRSVETASEDAETSEEETWENDYEQV